MAKRKKSSKSTKMRTHSVSQNRALTTVKTLPHNKLLVVTPLVALATMLIVVLSRSLLPPEVPLFYGLPEGEDQLVSSLSLIIPSLVSLAIFAINTTLVYFIRDKFIQSALVIATFAVTLLGTITTVRIITLVNSFPL